MTRTRRLSPLPLSPNGLGSLYMVIGSLGYVINDGLVRLATDEGLDVYQVLFLRGVAMSVLFGAAGGFRTNAIIAAARQRPVAIRVLAELGGSALFFAALVQMEFANAQTILMLVPFAVTFVAAVALGEQVSIGRYGAVIAGFVGVLIAVRPASNGFNVWALAIIASAGFLVVREFATRRVDANTSALPIATLTAMGLTALTGFISFFTGWGNITGRALVLIGLACGFLIVGYVFTIQTVRVGDLSVSAPFRYTTLVGAVIIGRVFFAERPDAATLIGCAVIIVAGVSSTLLDRSPNPPSRRGSPLPPR